MTNLLAYLIGLTIYFIIVIVAVNIAVIIINVVTHIAYNVFRTLTRNIRLGR